MPKRGSQKSSRNRTARCSKIIGRKEKRRRSHSPTLFINGKEIIKPQWREKVWNNKQGGYVPTGQIAEQSNKCNLIGYRC